MSTQSAALLRAGCEGLGISLEQTARDRLLNYIAELIKWNKKMNLVAPAPLQELLETHFLDSLTLLPLIKRRQGARLLDVGTGAGFPGLVLKCVLPSLPLTLIEPREKRVIFLRHLIRRLELDEVEIVAERLTAENPKNRTFPLITSRALSSISDFLTLVRDWCPPEGEVICMKGPKAREELQQWRDQGATDFLCCEDQRLSLPFSAAERHLLLFRKQRPSLS